MAYLVPASANQLGEQSSSLTSTSGSGVAKAPLAVVRGPGSRGGKGFFRLVTKGKFKGQVLYCYGTYTQIHDSLQTLKANHSDPVDSDVFDQFLSDLENSKGQSGAEAGSEDIEGTGPLVDHAQTSVQDGVDPATGNAVVRVYGHAFQVGNDVNSLHYPSGKPVASGDVEELLGLIGGLVVGVDHADGQSMFSESGQLGISGLIAAIQSHVPKKDASGNHHITHEFAMMVLQNLQSMMINAHSKNTNEIRSTLSKLAQTIRAEFPENDFEVNAQAALNTQAEVWMQHGSKLAQSNINTQGHLDQNETGEGWDTQPDSKTRDIEDLGGTPAPDEYVKEVSRTKMASDDKDGHGSEIGDTESLKEQAARVFELVKSRANQILQKYFANSQTNSYQKEEINDVIRNFLSPQSVDGKERDQYEQAQQLLLGKGDKEGSTSAGSVRISGSGSVEVVPMAGLSKENFDRGDWSDDTAEPNAVPAFPPANPSLIEPLRPKLWLSSPPPPPVVGINPTRLPTAAVTELSRVSSGAPSNRALSVLNAMAYTLGITPDGIWKSVFRSISDTGALANDFLREINIPIHEDLLRSVDQNIIDKLSEHFLLYRDKDASGPSLSNISEDSHSRITEQAAILIVELTRMNSKDFSKIESNPQVGNKDYGPYIDMVAKWRKIYKGSAGIVDAKISYFNKDQILKQEVKGGFAIDDPDVQALISAFEADVAARINEPEFPAHLVTSARAAGFLSTLQTLTDRILFFETLKANLKTGGAYSFGETTLTNSELENEYQIKIDSIKKQFRPLLQALETHFSANKKEIADVNYALIKRLGLFGKGAIQTQDPELMLSDGINTERLGTRAENPAFSGNMQVSRWNKKISAVNADSSNLIADPLALSVKDKINFENWNLDFFKQLIASSSRPVIDGQTRSGFVSGDVSRQSAPIIITLQHIAKAMLNESLPNDEDEYPVIGENSNSNPFNVHGSLRQLIDILKEKYSQGRFMPMQEFMNLLTNKGKSKLQGIQHEDIESIVQKTVLQAQECKRLGISPVPITSISGYLPEMGSVSQDPASRRDEIYGSGSTTSASAPLVYFLGGNGHVLQTSNRIAFYDDPILNVDELQKDVLAFFSNNKARVARQIEVQSGESENQSRTEYTAQFKSAITTLFSQLNLHGIDTGTTFSETKGHLDLNHITGNGQFKETEKGNTVLGVEQLMPFFNQLRAKVKARIDELSQAAEALHYQAIESPIAILVSENPYISEKNNTIDNSGKYFMQSDKLLAQKISEFAKSMGEPMGVGVVVIPSLERYSGVQTYNLPTSTSINTAIEGYVANLNEHERLAVSPEMNDTAGSFSAGTKDMAQNLQNPDAPERVITVHDAEYPTLLKMDAAKSTSGPEVLFTSKKDSSGKLSKIFGSTMRVLVRQISKDNLQKFLGSDAAKDKSVVIEKSELDKIFGRKFADISEFLKKNNKINFIIVGSPDDSLSTFSNCTTVSAHPFSFFSSSNPNSKMRLNDNAQLALRLSAGLISSSGQTINSDIPQISWDNVFANDQSFQSFVDQMTERSQNNEFAKMGNDRSVSWQEFFLNSNDNTIGGIDNSAKNVCLLSPYPPSVDHAELQQTDKSYKIPYSAANDDTIVSPPESDLDEIDPAQTYTMSSSADEITKNGGLRARPGTERLHRFLTRMSLQRGLMIAENIKRSLGFSGIVGHISANSLQYKMASEFADTQKRLFVLKPSWFGSVDSEKAVLDRENPAGSVIDVTGRAPSASDRFDSASLARIQRRFQPVSMRSILRASNVDEVPVEGLNDDEATVVKAIHTLINSYVQSLNHDIKHGIVTSTLKKVGMDTVLVAPHKRDKKASYSFRLATEPNPWYEGPDADGWVYPHDPDQILTEARGAGNLPTSLLKFIGNLDAKSRSAYLAYRAASKAHLTKGKSTPLYPADSRTGNWALLSGKSLHRDRDIPIASFGSSSSSAGLARQERFAFQTPGSVPMSMEHYDEITPETASRRNVTGVGSWDELGDNQQRLGQVSRAAGLHKFLEHDQVHFFPSIGTGEDAYRWSLIMRLDNTPETHMKIQSNLFPEIHAEATYQHGAREDRPYSAGRVRLYSSSSNVPLMDIPMEHFLKNAQGLLDSNHAVNTAKLHYLTFDRLVIDLAARMISSYSTATLQEMYKDILDGKKSRVQDTVFPPNTWPTLDGGSHEAETRSGLWNVVQTPDRSILERTPASGSRIIAFPTVDKKLPKIDSLEDMLSARNPVSGKNSQVTISKLIRSWIFSQYRGLSPIQAPATVSSALAPSPLTMRLPPDTYRVEPPVLTGANAQLASSDLANIPSWNDPALKEFVSSLLNDENHENIIYGMDEKGEIYNLHTYNPNSPQYGSLDEFYAHAYRDMHATTNDERMNLDKFAEQEEVKRFDSFAIDHFDRPANKKYDKIVKRLELRDPQANNIADPESVIPISDKAISISKKLIEYWKSANKTMMEQFPEMLENKKAPADKPTPDQVAAKSLLRELSEKPGKRLSYLLDEDGNISQAGMGESLVRSREIQKRAFEKIREEIIASLRTMLSPIQDDPSERKDMGLPKDDPLRMSMQAKQQRTFVYFKKKVAWT